MIVLTDIEGTTSSIHFVHEVLFPYARAHLADFVAERGRTPEVRRLLEEVGREAGRSLSDAQAVAQLVAWIDEDRKVTPLKALQGMIWERGFRQGHFRAHVYEDAVRNLRAWHARGIPVYVYSSGSVQAQVLFFEHTEWGDLRPLFSGHFDTTSGGKKEPGSYRRIATAIGVRPAEVLFLSDVVEELDAARTAGMDTVWLVREGPLQPVAAHRQALDFDAVPVAGP